MQEPLPGGVYSKLICEVAHSWYSDDSRVSVTQTWRISCPLSEFGEILDSIIQSNLVEIGVRSMCIPYAKHEFGLDWIDGVLWALATIEITGERETTKFERRDRAHIKDNIGMWQNLHTDLLRGDH